MKNFLKVALPVFAVVGMTFQAGNLYGQSEMQEHPRIRAAFESLDGAMAELREAPHDFGGHRADALRDCAAAKEQLRIALAFRAGADHGRPHH